MQQTWRVNAEAEHFSLQVVHGLPAELDRQLSVISDQGNEVFARKPTSRTPSICAGSKETARQDGLLKPLSH